MLLDLLGELGQSPPFIPAPQAIREDIRSAHSEAFVRRVEAASQGERIPDGDHYGIGTSDTPIFSGMDGATRWLVGGTLEAARLIHQGKAKEVLQLGGGLHHAQRDQASGFCVYNDLSVAARYLTQQGLRVAYLDIDVHHGDGVQWLHYDDGAVLTLSLHESGRYLYPGTGAIHELGRGDGLGKKLNIPLEPFSEGQSYLEVFQQVSEAALDWFRPDVLLVQCGVDTHFADPLAELLLDTQTHYKLFALLRQYARGFASGAIYTLGGGYNLDATSRAWAGLYLMLQDLPIPEAVPAQWRERWEKRLQRALSPTFHDPVAAYPSIPRKAEIEASNRSMANKLMEMVKPYWK
jgi:acetoin utilization protein AcuC